MRTRTTHVVRPAGSHPSPPSRRRLLGLGTTAVLAAAATGVVTAPGASAAATSPVAASTTTLAATPPMGFNDWNAFKCNVSAQLIEQTADAMASNGMAAAGYQYVNIDDCWLASSRDAQGNLVPDPVKFPNGIKAVADYVHAKGLKLGIYEDAGTSTCAGYPGSLGHEAQDAATFAAWDVDYVKYDQCNIPWQNYPGMTHAQVDQMLYTTFSNALKATGRPIVFSACTGVDTTSYPWTWAPAIANLWRTTPDIQDTFASMLSIVQSNAALAAYAGPGHWNDPDMLEIGNGGSTTTEYQAEFSLWSEMAAPLIAGTSLTTASPQTLSIYENRDVIAVDQDALGKQGTLVSNANGLMTFAKPLADGDVSVVLLNATATPQTMSTTASRVGVESHDVALTDLWSHQTSYSTGTIAGNVPSHGVVMYRVAPAKPGHATVSDPSTTLSLAGSVTQVDVGSTMTVTATLTDHGQAALTSPTLSLSAPAGWTIAPGAAPRGAVRPGGSTSRTFTVTAPASAPPISVADLTATATYAAAGASGTQTSTLPLTLVSPVGPPWLTTDKTPDPAVFGQAGGAISISAAGTGISPQTTTTRGTTAASDSYAAVYQHDAYGSGSSFQATVAAEPAGRSAAAGIIARNDLTGANGSPEGVALEVTGSDTVRMVWDANGGTVVDTASASTAAQSLPLSLRLTRSGDVYTGWYSTDGQSWVQVAVATLPSSAAASLQDVGVFHDSGTAGSPNQADFTGVSLG